MKAIVINGSPRKKGHTAALLDKVREGLDASGCETKTVHLRDCGTFGGCISCLACKVKGSKCDGVCAVRDGLRPLLEEARGADILVIGSPVYFHYPVAAVRAFAERFLFPQLDYTNPPVPLLKKKIHSACLFTMHIWDEETFAANGYEHTLGATARGFEWAGSCETLCFKGLTVFDPPERYVVGQNLIDTFAAMKRDHYAEYEREAFALGQRLVEKARQ
ncbi:MAG: flavodoxin family protein [Kiritimatiellae bacterium]|nr:flavodoxin family protein [Kiritimatiellia bacterium]